jgi:3-oxoadipate enol-lactonase
MKQVLGHAVRGEGQPLVLLHGALVSRAMWIPQAELFSKTYKVISCDLPAHGTSSDIEGKYTIEALSHSVVRLLDALKIQQFHLCGHSLGGMVAQYLAVIHPKRVSKLILAETSFGTNFSLWERLQTTLARTLLQIMSQTTLVNLSARRYGSLNDNIAQFIKKEMMHYSRATTLRVMGSAFSFAGRAQLERITTPTLVLVGSENKSTHAQARSMQAQIPNARLEVIPHAHHLLNLDNPAAFNKAVLDFLAQVGN